MTTQDIDDEFSVEDVLVFLGKKTDVIAAEIHIAYSRAVLEPSQIKRVAEIAAQAIGDLVAYNLNTTKEC